jgi:hypothetical protein
MPRPPWPLLHAVLAAIAFSMAVFAFPIAASPWPLLPSPWPHLHGFRRQGVTRLHPHSKISLKPPTIFSTYTPLPNQSPCLLLDLSSNYKTIISNSYKEFQELKCKNFQNKMLSNCEECAYLVESAGL